MQRDLDIESLADVQRLLLPDQPRIAGIQFAVHYQPADIAAGDYYDLMPLTRAMEAVAASTGARGGVAENPARTDPAAAGASPDARDAWGLMVGDVSGHGPAAAMEAVQFDAILRTYRGDEPPGGPAGALTYANRYFFSRRPRRHFLTVFSALVEPSKGSLRFVSAGHPPAFLRRGGGMERLGENGDIPLGVLREHAWRNTETRMQAGDLLIAYTDGLIEAVDSKGRAFGIQRVASIIHEAPAEADAVMQALRDALIAHQGNPIGRDDQTILVVKQLA